MMDRLPTGNEISLQLVRQVKKSFEENDELLDCTVPEIHRNLNYTSIVRRYI